LAKLQLIPLSSSALMLLRSIYIAAISCIVAVNAATYPDAYITGPQTIQNSTYIPVSSISSIFRHSLRTNTLNGLSLIRLGSIAFETMLPASGSSLLQMATKYSLRTDKTTLHSMALYGL
jgi:hypothetical protein